MISSFFENSFSVERLIGSGGKSSYVESSSGIGHLRQMDQKVEQMNSIQFGEGWELVVEYDTDIIATDRVTVGTDTYTVRGVREDNFGSIRTKRVLLSKKKMTS